MWYKMLVCVDTTPPYLKNILHYTSKHITSMHITSTIKKKVHCTGIWMQHISWTQNKTHTECHDNGFDAAFYSHRTKAKNVTALAFFFSDVECIVFLYPNVIIDACRNFGYFI